MKERPILIAVIGYIIGILWGLYINFSIALFYFSIIAIYFISKIFISNNKLDTSRKKLKLLSIKRYFRYLR